MHDIKKLFCNVTLTRVPCYNGEEHEARNTQKIFDAMTLHEYEEAERDVIL